MSNSIDCSPQKHMDDKTQKNQNNKNLFSSEILVCGRKNIDLYVLDDTHGQLGLGQKFDINQDRSYQIMKICNYNLLITQISCGLNHTAFLTQKGHIYTIGNNEYGKLGINYKEMKSSAMPCLVESLQNYRCTQVVCGENHTIALTNQGSIFTWGYNKFGQLGTTQNTQYSSQPIEPFLGQNIQAQIINAGNNHSLFISSENNCYSVGDNQYGQLGINQRCQFVTQFQQVELDEQIFQVAGGINYTLFLNSRGLIFASGNNSFGQLGLGHRKSNYAPQIVSTEKQIVFQQIAAGYHSAAISQYGELYIWGTGIFGEYLSPKKFLKIDQKIKNVDIGYQFGAVIDQIGQVWTWGLNEYGQLGTGDFLHRSTPFPVSAIKKKNVSQLSCGNNFLICLSSEKNDQIVKEDYKQYTEVKVNPQQNESFINRTASNKKQKKSGRNKSTTNEKLITFNVEPSKLVKELEIKLVEEMDEKKKLVEEIKKLRNQSEPQQYQELIQCIETYENQYELIKQKCHEQQEQLQKDQQDNKILKIQVIQLNEQLKQQHQVLVDLTNQKQNIYINNTDRNEDYIKKISEQSTEINMLQQIIQQERQENKKYKQKIKNQNNIILQQKNAIKQQNQNVNCDQQMKILKDKQMNQNSIQPKNNQLENNIINLQQQLRQNQMVIKQFQSEKKTINQQDENLQNIPLSNCSKLLDDQKYDSISIIPTFSTQQKIKKETQLTDYSNLIGSEDLQFSSEFDSSMKYSNKTRQFIQKNSLYQSNQPNNLSQFQHQQKQLHSFNEFDSPEKINQNINYNDREQLLEQYKLNLISESAIYDKQKNNNDIKYKQNQHQSRPKSLGLQNPNNNKLMVKNCENRFSLNPYDHQELSPSFRKRQRQTSNILCNISNSDFKFQQNQDNQFKYYNK